MKKINTANKLGAVCSILVGISYIVIGATVILLPPDQRLGHDDTNFWLSLMNNPTVLQIQYWAFALGALLAVAVVQAISDTVRPVNDVWVRWVSTLAIIGFAITALDNFNAIDLNYQRAFNFINHYSLDDRNKLIGALLTEGLDVNGWFKFGVVGLWALVISIFALRSGAWPKSLSYVGIAVSIAYFLVLIAGIFDSQTLGLIAAGLGGVILAPIWYIWMGLNLYSADS